MIRIPDLKEFKDISLNNILKFLYLFTFLLYLTKFFYPKDFSKIQEFVIKAIVHLHKDVTMLLSFGMKFLLIAATIFLICSVILLILLEVLWKRQYFKYNNNHNLYEIRYFYFLKSGQLYYTITMWYILFNLISYLFNTFYYFPQYAFLVTIPVLMYLSIKIMNFLIGNSDL